MNPEVDCLTMTNQMICDKTGLSDKAINNLGKIGHICEKRNDLVDSSEIDMLNYIVGQDNFYDFLHYLKFFFDNEFRVPLALEGSSYVNANTSGAIVLGKKMIDNAGNDGYAAFADDISKFTDSYAIYNIEKILNTWKDNYKDN